MVNSVLHCILGFEARDWHFCTMRLHCKHDFINQKLIGFHIRAFVFFIAMLKHSLEHLFLLLSKYSKNNLLQVSVIHSSGRLIEVNASLLKSIMYDV